MITFASRSDGLLAVEPRARCRRRRPRRRPARRRPPRAARGSRRTTPRCPGSRREHDVDLRDVGRRRRPASPTRRPSTAFAAAITAVDGRRVREHGGGGADAPAGKALESVSWPSTASGFTRNCSFWLSPTCTPIAAERQDDEHDGRARRRRGSGDAARPRRSGPRTCPRAAASPTRGTNGQNRPRPKTTIAAGSTNSPNTIATTTPTAEEKPIARRLSCCASSRASSESVTVSGRGDDRLRRAPQRDLHRVEAAVLLCAAGRGSAR